MAQSIDLAQPAPPLQLPESNVCPRCGVAQCEWDEGPETVCEMCGHVFELKKV